MMYSTNNSPFSRNSLCMYRLRRLPLFLVNVKHVHLTIEIFRQGAQCSATEEQIDLFQRLLLGLLEEKENNRKRHADVCLQVSRHSHHSANCDLLHPTKTK